jgi:hypothetical protein
MVCLTANKTTAFQISSIYSEALLWGNKIADVKTYGDSHFISL